MLFLTDSLEKTNMFILCFFCVDKTNRNDVNMCILNVLECTVCVLAQSQLWAKLS